MSIYDATTPTPYHVHIIDAVYRYRRRGLSVCRSLPRALQFTNDPNENLYDMQFGVWWGWKGADLPWVQEPCIELDEQ